MNTTSKKTIILFVLAVSQFLVVLDSAIVNVALTAIKDALSFDANNLQWVVTAYILTFGGFLMLGGRTADLFGRRNVLVGGMIAFSVLSLLLGLSQSSTMLIVLRALQGLAGAFMSPAALSILLTTFKEGHERNKALGIWSMVASGGAAAGVFLGGLITQYLGWRWNFFVNVPIGLIASWGVLKYIPAHIKEEKDKKVDLPGAILITAGLIALVYGLTQAPEAGWLSGTTLWPLATSLVLIAGFIFNETKSKHPLVPLGIFKIRSITGGNLVMMLMVAGGLGLFFFASQYVQNVLHYSPFISGLCFLPIPIAIGVVSTRAAKLIGTFGFKPLLVLGTALVGVGMFILSLLTDHSAYLTHLLPAFLLIGVGLGLSFVSITVAATSGVPAHEAGLASGLINTSNQIGAALGIAILAVIANATTSAAIAGGTAKDAATLMGYQHAFFTAACLVFLAMTAGSLLLQSSRKKQTADTQVSIH